MPQGEAAVVALSRRRLFTGVGLSALAGTGGAVVSGRPSRSQPTATRPAVRAATVWRNGYAGLLAGPDGALAPHHISLEESGTVTVGARVPVRLPPEFQPWGIAATDDLLWITGTAGRIAEWVTVDNRVDGVPGEFREIAANGDPDLPDEVFDLAVWHHRPALYATDGDLTSRVDLPVPDGIGWGAATGVATDGRTSVVVALDGCPDPDAAVITRSYLAVSVDGGRTWRHRPLDDALCEGYATTLVATGGDVVAVSVDGEGTRRVRRGPLGSDDLELVDTLADGGPVAAAVPDGRGGVRFLTDAVAVNGAPDTWIAGGG